jgi:hypothetical protein
MYIDGVRLTWQKKKKMHVYKYNIDNILHNIANYYYQISQYRHNIDYCE